MRLTIRGELGSGKSTIINTLRNAGYTAKLIGTKKSGMNKVLNEIWEVNRENSAYPIEKGSR